MKSCISNIFVFVATVISKESSPHYSASFVKILFSQ